MLRWRCAIGHPSWVALRPPIHKVTAFLRSRHRRRTGLDATLGATHLIRIPMVPIALAQIIERVCTRSAHPGGHGKEARFTLFESIVGTILGSFHLPGAKVITGRYEFGMRFRRSPIVEPLGWFRFGTSRTSIGTRIGFPTTTSHDQNCYQDFSPTQHVSMVSETTHERKRRCHCS